jgi:hypothetical protein
MIHTRVNPTSTDAMIIDVDGCAWIQDFIFTNCCCVAEDEAEGDGDGVPGCVEEGLDPVVDTHDCLSAAGLVPEGHVMHTCREPLGQGTQVVSPAAQATHASVAR